MGYYNNIFKVLIFLLICRKVMCSVVNDDTLNLTVEYFQNKNIKLVCLLSCRGNSENVKIAKLLMDHQLRVHEKKVGNTLTLTGLDQCLHQWTFSVGVILDGTCGKIQPDLNEASRRRLFDTAHTWLVFTNTTTDDETVAFIDDHFKYLNLSVDADITVVTPNGDKYNLIDVFNFGKIQGNQLEVKDGGTWDSKNGNYKADNSGFGLRYSLNDFKYYDRWDFHNLTLRAITVVLNSPKEYDSKILTDVTYSPYVADMTKMGAILLNVLKQPHNFKFNITTAGLWIGSPERNSTLAVTNTLFWEEQDISYTSCRMFPQRLQWMDPYSPVTKLETKFYYQIPEQGVGSYEDRFLSPMSTGVWWSTCAAGVACGLVLAAAARRERRPEPGLYAFFSVVSSLFQQDYDDGVGIIDGPRASQARRMALFVLGMTSMVLYNYYTSSVVSWLLNAEAPSIATLNGLIDSDLELIFEDTGYSRGWLDNPGFFYYSGYTNPKEDELRDKKVWKAKRTVPLLQSVQTGIELVRSGGYAFHSEPYTASQVISRSFDDKELCKLGELQMMTPSDAYVMGQKRSPYRQFFVWSLMRLSERGHLKAWRGRVGGEVPMCSGHTPRALALGQAAPAFALLAQAAVVAFLMLAAEILWSRFKKQPHHRRRFIQ